MGTRTPALVATAILTSLSLMLGLIVVSGEPATAEDRGKRSASKFPFAVDAPVNTPLGSDAIYADTTDRGTAAFLAGFPELNSPKWTVSVTRADEDDPLAEIRDPETGEVKGTARIPRGSVTSDPPKSEGGDSWFAAIQPDGRTVVECYGMARVTDTEWTSKYVVVNDLRGSGITGGTRASGTSLLMGLIRQADIEQGRIEHALALSLPNETLKAGYVWPARLEDNDGERSYEGVVPMGSLFAIPPGIDVTSLGLDEDGLMLARALQNYGAYVVARSSTNALVAEVEADPKRVAKLRAAWKNVLHGLMRRVSNSSAENVAGGGTRRQPPLAPLAD